jgi:hypothetical protein
MGKAYQAATLETDWSKIEERIEQAQAAMRERLYGFSLDHGGRPRENQAIEKALAALAVFRQEAATWSAKNNVQIKTDSLGSDLIR